MATSPLWALALAVALYFLSSFMAQLTGGRLSRAYTIVYVAAWSAAAVVIAAASAPSQSGPAALAVAASAVQFVLKTATTYGWIAHELFVIHRLDDPFERKGLRGFVLLFFAGCLGFDLAVRDVTAVFGLSHKEIADRLFIAPETVKKHTYNAYRKLGVQNRVQLSYFVQNRATHL